MWDGVSVNYVAVLVAGIASMAIGMVWYLPAVFGNAWTKALGKKKDEMGKPGPAMILTFIAALVMIYVLAHFLQVTGATTVGAGLTTAFWIWLGFIASTMLTNALFEGRSASLFWINSIYQLVNLLVAAAILVAWK